MGKLIKFEFYKLIKNRAFYICLGVLLLLSGLGIYLNEMLKEEIGALAIDMTRLSCVMTSVPTSSISMMLGIFISLFVCEDYTVGTIRTILARGYSRFEIFFSKYLAVLATALVMTVAVQFFALMLGIFFFLGDEVSFGGEQIRILLCQFVVVIAYTSLFFAVATMLQKTGTSIAFCVVIPMLLSILLQVLDMAFVEKEIVVSAYWLDGLASSISGVTVKSHDLNVALFSSLAYIVVSLVGGWFGSVDNEY